MNADENKAIVQQFYDQWSAGAIDFDRLVHSEVTNHQRDRDPETGLENFRRAVEGVMGAVPDSTWTTLLVAEGDLVVCHNRWSGTYGGTIFREFRLQTAHAFPWSTSTSIASATAAFASTGSCGTTWR